MSSSASILVVDDDSTMQEMFDASLGGQYRITAAASGEEALAAVCRQRPDVILLDVEMPPGIDGYATCRRLKEQDDTAEIPVIFVSGHDCIEDRLKGYAAGGEDYITKPCDTQELEAKITHSLRAAEERTGLKQQAHYASSTAMTAMTSMSEMGALIEAVKSFGACGDYRALAEATLAGLALFGLAGATQIRSDGDTLTYTPQGAASPLAVSVINHMASMERIVQFQSRMAITYPHISLLVNDMPTDDPDRCGRLRDHLAMLVENAEARAQAIAASAESLRRGTTIERAIASITSALEKIDHAQRESQVAARLAVEVVTQRMETAYISVALSTSQEDYMAGILRDGLDYLLNTQTDVFELQNQLSSIVQELKAVGGKRAVSEYRTAG